MARGGIPLIGGPFDGKTTSYATGTFRWFGAGDGGALYFWKDAPCRWYFAGHGAHVCACGAVIAADPRTGGRLPCPLCGRV